MHIHKHIHRLWPWPSYGASKMPLCSRERRARQPKVRDLLYAVWMRYMMNYELSSGCHFQIFCMDSVTTEFLVDLPI